MTQPFDPKSTVKNPRFRDIIHPQGSGLVSFCKLTVERLASFNGRTYQIVSPCSKLPTEVILTQESTRLRKVALLVQLTVLSPITAFASLVKAYIRRHQTYVVVPSLSASDNRSREADGQATSGDLTFAASAVIAAEGLADSVAAIAGGDAEGVTHRAAEALTKGTAEGETRSAAEAVLTLSKARLPIPSGDLKALLTDGGSDTDSLNEEGSNAAKVVCEEAIRSESGLSRHDEKHQVSSNAQVMVMSDRAATEGDGGISIQVTREDPLFSEATTALPALSKLHLPDTFNRLSVPLLPRRSITPRQVLSRKFQKGTDELESLLKGLAQFDTQIYQANFQTVCALYSELKNKTLAIDESSITEQFHRFQTQVLEYIIAACGISLASHSRDEGVFPGVPPIDFKMLADVRLASDAGKRPSSLVADFIATSKLKEPFAAAAIEWGSNDLQRGHPLSDRELPKSDDWVSKEEDYFNQAVSWVGELGQKVRKHPSFNPSVCLANFKLICLKYKAFQSTARTLQSKVVLETFSSVEESTMLALIELYSQSLEAHKKADRERRARFDELAKETQQGLGQCHDTLDRYFNDVETTRARSGSEHAEKSPTSASGPSKVESFISSLSKGILGHES